MGVVICASSVSRTNAKSGLDMSVQIALSGDEGRLSSSVVTADTELCTSRETIAGLVGLSSASRP